MTALPLAMLAGEQRAELLVGIFSLPAQLGIAHAPGRSVGLSS